MRKMAPLTARLPYMPSMKASMITIMAPPMISVMNRRVSLNQAWSRIW